MTLTSRHFAARLSIIARTAVSWSADVHALDPIDNRPHPREPVERYLREMRTHLALLEEELNEEEETR